MSDAAGALPDSVSALPPGTRLAEFEVRHLLGVGGFGIVYLAFDHQLEREVAVKEYMPASMAGRTETLHVSLRSQSDAEVFALFGDLLSGLQVRAVTGDIGILMAAVRGISASDKRKAALLRHIWRPQRFRALLDRFSGRAPMPAARAALLARLAAGQPADLIAASGPLIGLREVDEIAARAGTLLEDAKAAPISALEGAMLYDLLQLQAPAPAALTHLRGIAVHLPAILPAVDRFAARLQALQAHGVDVDTLAFEASHGRTAMEYYDGFVFSFVSGEDVVASGGRYDALTAVLGQGRSIPAVGGIIRPHLVASLRGAA
jgi:ATP phosphoribosyltransferase regulatory subunit